MWSFLCYNVWMRIINPTRKWKGKTPLIKAKNKLWNTIRTYIFNKYDFTCFTCGAKHLEGSNLQLGHFHPGSTCPLDLYFDLDNLRVQCGKCNVFQSGNPHTYRYNLIKEIGEDKVKELDQRMFRKKPVKWYVADYEKEIQRVEELIHNLDK